MDIAWPACCSDLEKHEWPVQASSFHMVSELDECMCLLWARSEPNNFAIWDGSAQYNVDKGDRSTLMEVSVLLSGVLQI